MERKTGLRAGKFGQQKEGASALAGGESNPLAYAKIGIETKPQQSL